MDSLRLTRLTARSALRSGSTTARFSTRASRIPYQKPTKAEETRRADVMTARKEGRPEETAETEEETEEDLTAARLSLR